MADPLEQRLRTLEATLLVNPKDLWTRIRQGRVLLQLGRLDEAHTVFEKAQQLDAQCADAEHGLGDVAKARKDERAAIGHYRRAIELDPAHVLSHAELVEYHTNRADTEGVTRHLEAIVKAKPEDPEWLSRTARHQQSLENWERAAELFGRAHDRLPDDPELTGELGIALSRLDRLEQALGLLKSVAATAQPKARFLSALAEVYDRLDQPEPSREVWLRLVEQDPKDDSCRLGLCNSLVRLSRFDEALRELSRLSPAGQELLRARILRGNSELRLGRPKQALDALGPARQSAPGDATVQELVGEAELRLSRFSDAVTSLERALRYAPERVSAWTLLAETRQKLEQHDAASRAFEQAVALSPDDPELQLRCAEHERLHGSLERAVSGFLRVVELNDEHALGCLRAAQCYRALEQLQEAGRWVDRAIRLDPGQGEAQLLCGRVRFERGDPAAAVTPLQDAARLLPEDLEVRELLGRCLLAIGKNDRALAVFEEALPLSPERPTLLQGLGDAAIELSRYERAKEAYVELTRLVPQDASAHLKLGLCWEQLDNLAQAKESLSTAAQWDKLNPDLLFALGRVTLALGETEPALAALEQVERLTPGRAGLDPLLGRCQAELKRFPDAKRWLERAVSTDPDDLDSRYQLGRVLVEMGDDRGAEQQLLEVLSRRSDHVDSLILLGSRELAAGRAEQALERLKRAMLLRSDSVTAARLLIAAATAAQRHEEAVSAARAFIKLCPQELEPLSELALALERLGRYREAKDAWLEVLLRSPELLSAKERLGLVCARLGDFEPAVAHLAEGLSGDAPNLDSLDVLCDGYLRLGTTAEAASTLRRSVTIDPTVGTRWRSLGQLENQLGHELLAIEALERAIALGAVDEPARATLLALYRAAAQREALQGRHAEALSALDNALRFCSDDPDLYQNRAVSLHQQGRDKEAQAALARAVELGPSRNDVRLQLAELSGRLGDNETARRTYREVTERDANSVEAWSGLAHTEVALGHPKEAIQALGRAVAIRPELFELELLLGRLLCQQERHKEALTPLGNAAKARPLDPEVQRSLALCCRELGDDKGSLSAWQSLLLQSPNDQQALWEAACALFRLERFEEAVEILGRLETVTPFEAKELELQVKALMAQQRFEEALNPLDRLLELEPRDDLRERLLQVLSIVGHSQRTILVAQEIVAKNPGHLRAWQCLAKALEATGQSDRALLANEQLLSLLPGDQPTIERLVRLRSERAEAKEVTSSEEALPDLDAALKLAPEDANLWLRKGLVLERLSRAQEALDTAARAWELRPELVAAGLLRARLLLVRGRSEAAGETLQKILTIDPSCFEALTMLAEWWKENGDLTQAADLAERAVQARPDSADAQERRLALALDLRDIPKAVETLGALAKLRTLSVAEMRQLGMMSNQIEHFAEAVQWLERVQNSTPNDQEVLSDLALALQRSGREPESIPWLERLTRLCPEHQSAHQRLGMAWLHLGKAEAAVEALGRARRLGPPDPSILTALVDAYRALQQPQSVLEVLGELVELCPDDAAWHRALGMQRIELGLGEQAVSALVRCLELQPDPGVSERLVALRLERAAAAEQNGDRELAIAHFADVAERIEADGGTLLECTAALRRLGARADALGACEKANRLNDDVISNTWLGEMLLEERQADAALVRFERAVALKVDAIPALIGAAKACHDLGSNDAAEDYLRRVVRIDADNLEANRLLRELLTGAERLAEAEAAQRRVLSVRDDDAQAHGELAQLLTRQGKLEQAIEAYQKALQIAPETLDAARGLAGACHGMARYGEVLVATERVLRNEPEDAEMLALRGLALGELGRLPEAIETLSRALEHNKDDVALRQRLAVLCHTQGQLLVEQKDFGTALSVLRLSLAHGEQSATLLDHLSQCLRELGDRHEALRFAERANQQETTAARWMWLGTLESELGRADQARLAFAAAVSLDPAEPRAHSALGRALSELGRDTEAIAALQESARLLPDSTVLVDLAKLHVAHQEWQKASLAYERARGLRELTARELEQLAGCYEQLSKWQDAANSYADALEFESENSSLLVALGRARLGACEPKGAVPPLEKARRLDENHPEVDGLLAQGYAASGNHQQAILAAERQLKRRLEEPLLELLASCWQALGNQTEHARVLERIVACRSEDPEAWVELGQAQIRAGETERGIATLTSAWERSEGRLAGEPLTRQLLDLAAHKEAEGQREVCLELLGRAARTGQGQAELLFELAQRYLGLSEFALALPATLTALSLGLDGYEVWLARARAEQGMGDAAKALTSFERASRLRADGLDALVGAAACQMTLGRPTEARQPLLVALRHHRSEDSLVSALLDTLVIEEPPERRQELLQQMWELRTDHVDLRYALARIEARLGRNGQVVELLGELGAAEQVPFDLWLLRGSAELNLGRLEAAETSIRIALTLQPSNEEGSRLLGVVQARLGRSREAVDILEKAFAAQPTSETRARLLELYLGLADEAEQGKDLNALASALARVIELDPDAQPARYRLGRCYAEQNRLAEAADVLRLGLTETIERLPAWLLLGETYLRLARPDFAEDAFRCAVRLAPTEPKANRGLGLALARTEKFDQARPLLESAASGPGLDAELLTELARLYERTGDRRHAAETLQALGRLRALDGDELRRLGLSLDPDTDPNGAWEVLSRIVERDLSDRHVLEAAVRAAVRLGDPGAAAALLTRVVATIDKDESLWRMLGEVLAQDQRYAEALRALEQSVCLGNDQASTHQLRVSCAEKLSEPPRLLAALRDLTRTEPTQATAHASLAALVLSLGSQKEAIASYEKAVELDPRPVWLRELGRCYETTGQLPQALSAFMRVAELLPQDANAQTEYGMLRLAAGHVDAALDALSRALALDPNHQAASQPFCQAAWAVAEHLMGQNELERALFLFAQARAQVDPPEAQLYLEASCLSRLGRAQEAITLLERLLAREPGHETAAWLLATLLVNQSQQPRATTVCEQAFQHHPRSALLAMVLAERYEELSRFEDAARTLASAWPNAQERPDFAARYSDALLRIDRHGEALNVANVGLSRDPHSVELLHRAAVIHASLGQDGQCVELMGRALALDASMAVRFTVYAASLLRLNRIAEAQQAMAAGLQRFPEDAALHQLGVAVYRTAGHLEAAFSVAQRAVHLTGSAASYCALGELAAMLRDHQQAIAAFARAIELEPGNVSAWRSLANGHIMLGSQDSAIEVYRRAVQLLPRDATLRYELGSLLAARGRYGEATAEWQSLRELDPKLAAHLAQQLGGGSVR